MEKITIKTDFIKLNQFLKWSGAAHSGSHANFMIGEGQIRVNEEVETRRGRKIYPGDRVILDDGHQFLIIGEG